MTTAEATLAHMVDEIDGVLRNLEHHSYADLVLALEGLERLASNVLHPDEKGEVE